MENTIFLKDYTTHHPLELLCFNNHSANEQICQSNAALRLTSTFFDLLEKQFKGNAPDRKMKCRFPVDFALALSVHVNHLNRCLKDITGKTTSQHIADRDYPGSRDVAAQFQMECLRNRLLLWV